MAKLTVPYYLEGWSPRFNEKGFLTCWVKDGEEFSSPSAPWNEETKNWTAYIKGTVQCYNYSLKELIEVVDIFQKGEKDSA